jgi:1-aminocyclopropane-1-carboxylate deaminase
MVFLPHPSPLQEVHCSLFPQVQLWIKRDDLLHPEVSGNKYRKLKYPLLAALPEKPTIISMGGPWSNHLHALAHASKILGFDSHALVRGLRDEAKPLTATLTDCKALGMQLHFVSRDSYRQLREDPHAWQELTELQINDCYWLPEGGSSALAVKGVAELVSELPFVPDTIIVACGTGATLAGLVAGMQGQGRIVGIAAVQNANYLSEQVRTLLALSGAPQYQNFDILSGYEHGGFGKTSLALRDFCQQFSDETKIRLEPVYTGKMFYALHQLIRIGHFKPGERIVAIHTGGMQGLRGFK